MNKKEARKQLSANCVNEVLSYDRDAGEFTWRKRSERYFSSKKYQKIWNSRHAGKLAGSIGSDGYRTICIHKVPYKAHRLVWLIEFGSWPDEIDHINHNRLDNRVENLRDVSHKENGKNHSLRSNNASGVTGVSWSNTTSKWVASITINSKMIHLGRFKDFNDAEMARRDAEIYYGFHENHGKEIR